MSGKSRYSVRERLYAKVAVDADTGCWCWTGYLNPNGYARIGERRERPRYAHRVSYELHIGQIANGLTIDHLCRNRACINPAHLEAVSHRTNCLRGEGAPAHNARKTACVHGHDFTPANTIWERGKRRCRTCTETRRRARVAR